MPMKQMMWVENHRPAKLNELVDQETIKNRLELLQGKK